MISPQDAFSPSYARARVRFLEGAAAAGMAITSHNHPLPGRDGETLAMDVALDGSPNAEHLLIVRAGLASQGSAGGRLAAVARGERHAQDEARARGPVHSIANSRLNTTGKLKVLARARVSMMSATRRRRSGMPRIFSCAFRPSSFSPVRLSIFQ